VRELLARQLPAGVHQFSWDAGSREGERPLCGAYILRLDASGSGGDRVAAGNHESRSQRLILLH
jgi:hypothetical protein